MLFMRNSHHSINGGDLSCALLYGELGEFSTGFHMPEEMTDPFYEPESYCGGEAKERQVKLDGCISQMHYA